MALTHASFLLIDDVTYSNANSVPRRVDWGGSEHCRPAGQLLCGADPRAFFSGDSFLYTSKEKSYPLLRRRSGSPGSEGRQEKDNVRRKNWIPAFAGMTSKGENWIPAYAGMTSEKTTVGFQLALE